MHCFAEPGKTRGSHTYCVRCSMQSYQIVSGCDMLDLHLADYVYSHAGTASACGICSSQSVIYQLVKGETKDRKAKPCFVKKTVAALHVPNQLTVHFRLLGSHARRTMLNNHDCLSSSKTAQFAMRD